MDCVFDIWTPIVEFVLHYRTGDGVWLFALTNDENQESSQMLVSSKRYAYSAVPALNDCNICVWLLSMQQYRLSSLAGWLSSFVLRCYTRLSMCVLCVLCAWCVCVSGCDTWMLYGPTRLTTTTVKANGRADDFSGWWKIDYAFSGLCVNDVCAIHVRFVVCAHAMFIPFDRGGCPGHLYWCYLNMKH